MEAIRSGQYDMLILNFANPDMVGHTGSLPATVKAVEAVDAGLGAIADAVAAAGGALLATADHGNAEVMRDPGHRRAPHGPHHQPRPGAAGMGRRHRMRDGRLADLAPTMLHLLGLQQPGARDDGTIPADQS